MLLACYSIYMLAELSSNCLHIFDEPVNSSEADVRSHMTEAAPHHLELIDQFLVQGTHFRMHQFLVDSQTHAEDMNLLGLFNKKHYWMFITLFQWFKLRIFEGIHLFLHQILELGDLLCILWVTADVLFIEECLA